MSNPIRMVVPIDCQNPSALEIAIACAKAIEAQTQQPVTEFILLTHTKEQLNHTALADHIGERATNELLKNNSVNLPKGGNLYHATLQTLRRTATGTVIIAYFAEDEMMEKIDGLIDLVGVVAVPEPADAINTWSARWNPFIYGQQQSAPVKLLTDAVVEKALLSLTRGVNLSNGVMNPRDKQSANETLRILRAKGHNLDAEKIKSWAIQNGWKPTAATELAKLATSISKLKSKPSIKTLQNADGKYQLWNE